MYQEANSAQNLARKQDARKRIAFFEDYQLGYIEQELSKYFSEPEKLKICFINIVKKIINLLAMVYVQDAKREVEGTERDREIFSEIAKSTALPVKWKMINRYTVLCKTLTVRPVWRQNKMDIDVITPDILDIKTGDTPEQLIQVIVTHYPESGKSDEVTFSVWTIEEFKKLDYRGNIVESQSNIYSVIPYVPIWDRCPTSSFFLSGGDDLIVIQESISEKLSDLLYTIRHQGFSTGYIKQGHSTGGSIHVDPGTLIELNENGEIGYASAKAPIKDIIEAIQFLISQAAVSNGLPAASLSTKNVDESGIAKIAGNRELEEYRRDQIALYARYESNLFEMFKIIWNVHNPGRKISEKARLQVDFFDPKPVLSPDKQADTWDKLIALGVASPVDAILERNPDLKTREDALAFLLKVQTTLITPAIQGIKILQIRARLMLRTSTQT
jgi:hypothetical protein